jgi:hypothetical protein
VDADRHGVWWEQFGAVPRLEPGRTGGADDLQDTYPHVVGGVQVLGGVQRHLSHGAGRRDDHLWRRGVLEGPHPLCGGSAGQLSEVVAHRDGFVRQPQVGGTAGGERLDRQDGRCVDVAGLQDLQSWQGSERGQAAVGLHHRSERVAQPARGAYQQHGQLWEGDRLADLVQHQPVEAFHGEQHRQQARAGRARRQ